MKIVVTSQGQTLESPVDPRFGRAAYFLVVDPETLEFTVAENKQNMNLPQGAGIQAGKTVADIGADALVTGHCGPKAFTVLKAAGVDVFTGASGSVAEAVDAYNKGALKHAAGPDVDGHWV